MPILNHLLLDPGHGGKDDGAVWDNHKEKDITLDISRGIYEQLKTEFQIIMTRVSDVYPTLSKRAYMARRHNVDALISIHINADPDSDDDGDPVACGGEIYTNPAGTYLAEKLKNSIISLTPRWRGIKDGSHLYICREITRPSVLVELGFIDNPAFHEIPRLDWSMAISEGIMNYRR